MRTRVAAYLLILGALAGLVLPRVFAPADAGAGVTVIGGTTTLPAGGGTGGGSGNIQTPDGGVATRTIMVADNDGGTVLAATAVSIDPSGNITAPSGGTFNGRDIVADGVEQDSYPLDPMPSSMMSPGDAGFIQGVYQGSTYITNGDAGYTVPACTILVPLRSSCTVRVRWQAAIVSGIDAGAAVSGGGAFCRVYSFSVGATGISAAPNSVACQTDWTGVTAGVTAQYDGSVLQPTFQGPAATNLRLDCFVDDIVCTYNP